MRKGFTLLEVAVVIVIIGLIVGGVVVGASLIRSSEVRSILSDIDAFKSAITTFRTRYKGWPGDLSNATDYWSTTTNGGGDEYITYVLAAATGEEYFAWQHLALAGMIPGTFTGLNSSLPRSKMKNAYYRISYKTGVYGKDGHMISINGYSSGGFANQAVLSSKDVYSLDLKADDGLADSGEIMGFNVQGVPGCVTNDYTAGSGSYIATTDTVTCKVFFVVDK